MKQGCHSWFAGIWVGSQFASPGSARALKLFGSPVPVRGFFWYCLPTSTVRAFEIPRGPANISVLWFENISVRFRDNAYTLRASTPHAPIPATTPPPRAQHARRQRATPWTAGGNITRLNTWFYTTPGSRCGAWYALPRTHRTPHSSIVLRFTGLRRAPPTLPAAVAGVRPLQTCLFLLRWFGKTLISLARAYQLLAWLPSRVAFPAPCVRQFRPPHAFLPPPPHLHAGWRIHARRKEPISIAHWDNTGMLRAPATMPHPPKVPPPRLP